MALIQVTAEISGSVWKIETKAGQRVMEEDVLLIMESMKMEIPIMAPAAGVVKEIKVKEGDTIAEGDLAVVLED
ncbi:biotin/lipoyl-binding carrier protein [Peribacillus butanolivorans]|uniref:biotin/lipoyl-binding carrier protein n=1 Tax=Peribacillus butanolivorans TaxID=421767 RepID=UPI00207C5DBA|nr:biotin/lipoyl-binding carrier protein [Peribacillus butanolivorans]MCO0600094.1 biotin/lipoyl-binding carrier protein [Peribacillus butanolivorans]